MKRFTSGLLILFTLSVTAQVGINTTDPKALLDIPVSNAAAPSNMDGILIPRVANFPAINPSADQNGMLVFLTEDFEGHLEGFYYWDNQYTTWVKLSTGNPGGSLDQAYNFGGDGAGALINADTGPVTIGGFDGLYSTGYLGAGNPIVSGSGPRLIWNPRKAAFRVGHALSNQWDDANVGEGSFAAGDSGTASGPYSTALGRYSNASGYSAFAMGPGSLASGYAATAMGENSAASGNYATAIGLSSNASGLSAVSLGNASSAGGNAGAAIGNSVISQSISEVAVGGFNTVYSGGINASVTWNATDRIFSVGNGTSYTLRSDALNILKNGLATLPSVTNTLIDAESTGKAIVTKEWVNSNAGGTLDESYDHGGAGFGKTITADAGAVTIDGTDGLVSTGTSGNGAIMPSGNAVRMVWNPRKGAFRAGAPATTSWDDANVGFRSVAFGASTTASGQNSTALGEASTASGLASTAIGYNTTANNSDAIAMGTSTVASGVNATAMGNGTTAPSFIETSLGRFNSAYTLGTNGSIVWNATDRLFSVGNGTGPTVRSNAMTILKNGLATLPSVTNALIDAEVSGKAIVTKEWVNANAGVTLNDAYNFGGAGAGRTITANSGSVLINGTDGFAVTGTSNTGEILTLAGSGTRMFFYPRKNAIRAGRSDGAYWDNANIGNYSTAFGINTTASGDRSVAMGGFNLASGLGSAALGNNNTATGYYSFSTGLSNQATAHASNAMGSDNVAQGSYSLTCGLELIAESYAETVFGYYNALFPGSDTGVATGTDPLFVLGNGTANSSRSNALAVLKNGRMALGNISPLGQFQMSLDSARKPGTNTWTITSDERLKNIHGNYSKGLSEITRLDPITYNYKNVGAKTFEAEILNTEYSGFSAQQVQQIFPEAVGMDEDGYLNLNIHPILIASVNALKELNLRNVHLESENLKLKQKISVQEELLADLLKRVSALETK